MPRFREPEEPPRRQPTGLVCRTCGCQHFFVIYVRHLPGGIVKRLRECRHCGRRVSTREKEDA